MRWGGLCAGAGGDQLGYIAAWRELGGLYVVGFCVDLEAVGEGVA